MTNRDFIAPILLSTKFLFTLFSVFFYYLSVPNNDFMAPILLSTEFLFTFSCFFYSVSVANSKAMPPIFISPKFFLAFVFFYFLTEANSNVTLPCKRMSCSGQRPTVFDNITYFVALISLPATISFYFFIEILVLAHSLLSIEAGESDMGLITLLYFGRCSFSEQKRLKTI